MKAITVNDLRHVCPYGALAAARLHLLSWMLAWPACADWHGSVSLASDHVYRGYSKSHGEPVVQGNLDYEYERGLYGGLGIAQVSFEDRRRAGRSSVELRPYVGWAHALSERWRGDLALSYYVYDDRVFARNADYGELSAALNYRDVLTLRVSFAPDAYRRHVHTLDYEMVGRYDFVDTVQISAGLGFHQAGPLMDYDYFYWNAGITWFPLRHVSADFRYVDADVQAHHPAEYGGQFSLRPLDNKFLFSLSFGY